MSKEKQYCFCRREAKGFMIECDGCGIWFHGPCVKMDNKSSKAVDLWYCLWCTLCRDSAKSVIEEQEIIQGEIKTIKAELENLKEAVKLKTDPREPSDQEELIIIKKACEKLEDENGVLKKNYADISKEMDSLKAELALKLEELDSVNKNFQNFQAETLLSKRKWDSDIDKLEREIASKKEETDNMKLTFQSVQEKQELEKEKISKELDEAYSAMRALRESNNELQKQELEKEELRKELDEAYSAMRALRESNNELQNRVLIKRKKLSLSQSQN